MKSIGVNELREKYLKFFELKGHAVIPSAPLVPENDPSVLFTTAGMHPLVPYLKGEKHPDGVRLADAQKCLRTTDIDEVGDATHATVFEMLGNWSLGDYFKEDAIAWSWEFLTSPQWLGLDPNYLAVSVFAPVKSPPATTGQAAIEKDEESAAIWKKLGVPELRIAYLGLKDNWWPAGGKHTGPQGPCSEMFYWTGGPLTEDGSAPRRSAPPAGGDGDYGGQPGAAEPPRVFDPRDPGWVEIWNDVFMQFNRLGDGHLEELPQKNVDTGMGLERTVMILNGMDSIYEIDSFAALIELIRSSAGQTEERPLDPPAGGLQDRHVRIVADHIKAAAFLLGDANPVLPSNTDQGYVLRRLIRRAVRSARVLEIDNIVEVLVKGAGIMAQEYGSAYPSMREHESVIYEELSKEGEKFLVTLDRGLKKIGEYLQNRSDITGQQAFELFTTYGFPIEMQIEEARKLDASVDVKAFEEELAKHRDLSRTAAAGKFKGGLADHSEESVRYHTATHLLHQALRDVLGDHVLQKGSNITPERLRFDFSHPDKMTAEEIAEVENIVNAKIQAGLAVKREEMSVEEAKERGALGLFEHKYGDTVNVYTVGDYSCEICGGPHVGNTSELGVFKITKEESAGSGVRRIKAVFT